MFQINISEKIETHILCSMTVSFENHTVYEAVSKNIVNPEELRMTSQNGASTLHAVKSRLHARTPPRIHAPWHPTTRIHAHTHTHTHRKIRNIYCFSTATNVTTTRFSVTLYVHCVSRYLFYHKY
jgi:hypothetical protein